jgi:hypothetical protein
MPYIEASTVSIATDYLKEETAALKLRKRIKKEAKDNHSERQ